MKFIADAMLGRLARWMRFLGYDVLYMRDIEDRELVRVARAENRIVLTRDRSLVERFHVQHLLISSENIEEQLVQIMKTFPLNDASRRCMKCNSALDDVKNKEEVRDLVPEYVFLHTNRFQRCPECGTVYWEGTHTKNFKKIISRLSKAIIFP